MITLYGARNWIQARAVTALYEVKPILVIRLVHEQQAVTEIVQTFLCVSGKESRKRLRDLLFTEPVETGRRRDGWTRV